jgi:hypothetical protein
MVKKAGIKVRDDTTANHVKTYVKMINLDRFAIRWVFIAI